MDVNDDCGFVFERGEEQVLVSDWDPLLSMDPGVSFHGSAGFSSYLVGLPGFQGVVGSGCGGRNKMYSGTVGDSLGLYETGHVRFDEKNIKPRKRKGIPECDSNIYKVKAAEAIREENVSLETVRSSSEKDENKVNGEENSGCQNQKSKNPNNGDAAKVDYIHVRAKRGQATNSHSLAERVRREKISERMKLLQDLVPGCNKINGKAMMLDEIINYVQSLQRQVEFLSMKLASINPDISSNIKQILLKDGGSAASFGFSHGMNLPPHSFRGGALQSNLLMCDIPRIPDHSIPWMVQMPRPWELCGNLHGLIPNGFIADAQGSVNETNGAMKVEQ